MQDRYTLSFIYPRYESLRDDTPAHFVPGHPASRASSAEYFDFLTAQFRSALDGNYDFFEFSKFRSQSDAPRSFRGGVTAHLSTVLVDFWDFCHKLESTAELSLEEAQEMEQQAGLLVDDLPYRGWGEDPG
ncbi:BQ5605_C019g08843 [Microbotryum silenes-dioicae]|uniref:BQ5605_C019g08843 protein n=1 Tax=Microbotryum silenes-dioicae TaxID=796604 RepID=A0A2X0NZV3_9BASI|nr:BQ5605_C019g08843 [Microbotryum silenes-dioicae]